MNIPEIEPQYSNFGKLLIYLDRKALTIYFGKFDSEISDLKKSHANLQHTIANIVSLSFWHLKSQSIGGFHCFN